ncbi:hypothetical protein THAOC_16536 [Thalassiosira oceanica]|uniref:Sulfotransferase domain-containing protein n=1 Tax=Thalassiosira oceanica TaxID=159749 RepID=K0SX81_THAOC|nr:hypothetical protein THAOC_16536 [Thalassiosira oceanica]|eukprot:EJK62837.1 hypothetical protein THAOC_16536 [Thalassiosira oceanica]
MRSTPDYEMPEQPSHRMLQARDWSWTDKLKRTSDAPIHGGQHETAIYWHIPKSGGTTAKRIYECLGVTLAARVGGQIGNAANDTELKVVQPWINRKAAARPQYTSYVNVDITSKEGIQKARSWGLVESGLVDVIFSPVPVPVIQNLFSDRHQGRGLVVFRNPVERLISKFYYLQVATWEVKGLAGVRLRQTATVEDLENAKIAISERFFVGLTKYYAESIRRFNAVLGIDASTKRARGCRRKYYSKNGEYMNSNPHDIPDEGSAEWNAVAAKNELDLQLYKFVERLFREQREQIDSFRGAESQA